MSVKFLDLHVQYLSIRSEIDAAIAAVISESAFIDGKFVKAFEEEFAAYQGTEFCVGVGNGTDAIEIALEALSLPPGSEVLVPANSFIASSEAVTRSGHRVVFCDCDPDTYTISVEDAARRISPRTKALIAVHLYGRPCAMGPLLELAAAHELVIIEDCAQAHGAEYEGQRVGTFGAVATFSFYPGKNLGAYGDAGAILTNDSVLTEKCRKIANHGRICKYDHEFEGRNSRLDGLQGAILSVKLRHLEGWLARRIAVADLYRRELAYCTDVVLPAPAAPGMRHVYHLFVIRTKERDGLRGFLKEQGIECGIHYPMSLPRLAAYDYFGQGSEVMFANRACHELLSLPMGEHLADTEVLSVAAGVKSFFSERGC